MRTHASYMLLLAAACTPPEAPRAPVTVDVSASAARGTEQPQADAPPAGVLAFVRDGALWIAPVGKPGKAVHVVDGVPPSSELVLAPNGKTAAFVAKGGIAIVDIATGQSTKIAFDGIVMKLAGIDTNGDVWFLDRAGGDFHHVLRGPAHGGPAEPWRLAPEHGGFVPCDTAALAVSDEGTVIAVGVDDGMGWPECTHAKTQGIYVVDVGASALPAPTICFPHQTTNGGVNLAIRELAFAGERLEVVAYDVWAKEPAAEHPLMSCRTDGSDYGPPRPRWTVAVVDVPAGQTIVAQHPAHGTRLLVGPINGIGAIAFRPDR